MINLKLYCKLQMYSQISKLTTITDHSLIRNTEQHYIPLRNALLKSQFSHQYASHPSQIEHTDFHSRISNKICKLTPQLVKDIRNTSFIPIQSQLIPTKNLYKVTGKQFSILDVQEKTKDPLTASQFGRLEPCHFQQLVYQVKDNGNSLLTAASEHKKKTIKLITQGRKYKYYKANAYATKQSNQYIQTIESKPTKPFNIDDTDQYIKSTSKQYSRIAISQGIQKYRFKTDILSQGSTSRSSRDNQKKQYKYNLFSLFDDIGNNGCGGTLLNNQVCAARIANDSWI